MERFKALLAVVFFVAALIFADQGGTTNSGGYRKNSVRQFRAVEKDTILYTPYKYQPDKQPTDF
jgi:hypothetical protein